MAGVCVVRFDGGCCLIKDIIEGHPPELGKSLPDAYREGFGEVVIGVFEDGSQKAKLLGIIQQLDGFDRDSNSLFTNALIDITREISRNESNLAASNR